MKLVLALCGTALVAACSSVPMQPTQKVESNLACDKAYMERVDRAYRPTMLQRYWVNCPTLHDTATAKTS